MSDDHLERRSQVITQADLADINERLVNHCTRLDGIETRLDNGAKRMERIEKTLDENTAMTREVVEILDAGKAAFKLLHQIGVFAKWLSAIGGAVVSVWAVWHLGPEK